MNRTMGKGQRSPWRDGTRQKQPELFLGDATSFLPTLWASADFCGNCLTANTLLGETCMC